MSIKKNKSLSTGICSLCKIFQPLIKAHIYPRQLYSLFKQFSGNVAPSELVPFQYSKKSLKIQQWQSGFFDHFILCHGCDNGLFGPWDKYAQNFLARLANASNVSDVIDIPSFDYHSLKLFFLSVLWRAAATTLPFFANVQFGIWQEKLRAMLLAKNPGSLEDFSVILVKFEGEFALAIPNNARSKAKPAVLFYFLQPEPVSSNP